MGHTATALLIPALPRAGLAALVAGAAVGPLAMDGRLRRCERVGAPPTDGCD